MAAMKILVDEDLSSLALERAAIFKKQIQDIPVKALRSAGLWMALEFEDSRICKMVVDECILNGVLTDWFLFAPNCLRISPPLNITGEEIDRAANVIHRAVRKYTGF
ncbi:MAG: hypothetical protein ACXWV0_07235 [Flavisolibacter sp.]